MSGIGKPEPPAAPGSQHVVAAHHPGTPPCLSGPRRPRRLSPGALSLL